MKKRLHKVWTQLRSRFGIVGLLLIVGIFVIEILDGRALLRGDVPDIPGLFQRGDSDAPLSINDRIKIGMWEANVVITILGVILVGLCWFWAKRLPDGTIKKIDRDKLGWTVRLFLFVAIILGAAYRAPRLNHSLWNDEELAVRKYIMGSYHVDPATDDLAFRPVSWERTLFYSLSGNNHIVQSVASRAGNTIWAKATDAPPGTFNESALRMGSFLAGIATIGLLGYWLGRVGYPLAGVTAAFVLALNPWHIRYSVEARGYSLLLFFVILLFFSLRSALITHRWRWWLCYGAAQAMALLSFAASLFLVLPLNLIVLYLLIKNRDQYGFWRWFFVCTCGAGLVALFMFPTIIGSMGWLKDLEEVELNSQDWPRELWGHMMLGTHWYYARPEIEHGIGIRNMMSENFLKQALISVGIPLLTLAGLTIMFLKKVVIRLHLAILVGGLILILIYRQLSDTPFHVWYAIYVIFLFVIPFAFLGETTRMFAGKKGEKAFLKWLPVILAISFYGWISHQPRSSMIAFQRHPMRDAVASARGEAPAIGDNQDSLITVALGSGARQMLSYDPRVISPKSRAEFELILEDARKNSRPLAVYAIGLAMIEQSYPDIHEMLENREHFEKLALEKGIEGFWCIQVYQAKHQTAER